ncbi:MAG: dihydroorotate dehydrogenase electron transfer subunit [Bacteroidales bacterium]|nr:dihydroorotate dehydrogenase electron transfer subunit [Bacteroidales bacterium]
MKKIIDFTVIDKQSFQRAALLRLRCDSPLPEIRGGQFVNVLVEGCDKAYLRRPISIHDVDYQNNTIDLLIQEKHEGTKKLCALPVGAKVNVVLPLGNGFTMPEKDDNVLLVGGGIGIAPLLYFAKMICKDARPCVSTFLLGGRTKDDLMLLDRFRSVGDVFITTNDGSMGEKGFVTEHSLWNTMKINKIYACGPMPMMKAVAKVAKEKGIWCEVSLENQMACGIGACLCCVENTKEGNLCVCKEGPVFNIERLLW